MANLLAWVINTMKKAKELMSRKLNPRHPRNPPPPPPADTLPPSIPAGLTGAVISPTQINLSWIASADNVGVAGYNVLRNGIKIGTASVASYQDGQVSAGATYGYAVSAYDAAGNTSANSTLVTVSVPAPLPADTTPPPPPADTTPPSIPPPPSSGTKIGTKVGQNLTGVWSNSTEVPFLNLIKMANIMAGNADRRYPDWRDDPRGCFDLDANGYPQSMVGKAGGVAAGKTFTQIDFGLWINCAFHGAAGNYVFLCDGTGNTFNFQEDAATAASHPVTGYPNRWVIPISTPANGIRIGVTALGSPHATNWRLIYSPDSDATTIGTREAAYNAGEIWNPDFITQISPYKYLRFMDWLSTNTSYQRVWSDRPIPEWWSWADYVSFNYPGNSIAPVEVMVDLCNRIGADPWLCMPPLSTYTGAGNYVSEFAALVKNGRTDGYGKTWAGLDTARKARVEYGNEIWNGFYGAFSPAIRTQLEADSLAVWPDNASGWDRTVVRYPGMRAAVDGVTWRSIMGADKVIRVYAGQAANDGQNNYVLNDTAAAAQAAGGGAGGQWTGTIAQCVDEFSTASYFGPFLFPCAWANGPAGITKLFDEMNSGSVMPKSSAGTTGGTATAFTFNTGQSHSGTPADMDIIAVTPHTHGEAAATFARDTETAYPIFVNYNTPVVAHADQYTRNMQSGIPVVLCFNASSMGWQFCDNSQPWVNQFDYDSNGGIVGEGLPSFDAVDAAVATSHGLPWVCYEGGQQLTVPGAPFAPIEQYVYLYGTANLDSRMGDVYTRMLNFAQDSGCELFMHLNDAYLNLTTGGDGFFWGALSSVDTASSPKNDALVNFIAAQATKPSN